MREFNIEGMTIEEKQKFAKDMAKVMLNSQGIDVNEEAEIMEAEVDEIISSTNMITSSSVSSLTRRGEMTQDAMGKLNEITNVAQSTSKAFKKKTFLGIPLPSFGNGRLKKVDLKLKDAQDLITVVSSDLDDFEHTLKGDVVTLGQSVIELEGYSEKIGGHIEISNMIVEQIKEQTAGKNLDGTEFALKLNQVNNKIAVKEKKRAIINTAILQLREQKREALAIVENVKDTKEIVPLMMSVSALVAASSDTQATIQNTLEDLNAKANEMFIENIDSQMALSKKVKNFNVAENDKEVVAKISEFIKHIDKNKADLLVTRKDIEGKIKMLKSVNTKLDETIKMEAELEKVNKLA